MYEGNKKTRDDHRRQRGLSPRRTASNNNNHNGSSSSLTGLNAINSRLIHRASARSSTTSSSSGGADLLDDASNQSHGNGLNASSSSRLSSIGVGRATSMSSPFGSRDPTANSRRSHIRRSQSFKRTAGGSTPPAASSLLGGMTPQELLGSSDHDLLGSDSNMSVGAAAALATNTAERMTRPRLTSNTSGTSIGSNSSVPGSISTTSAPTTTATTTGTSFASKSTSTRQFVKNFLEDYDDDYDVSGKVGGGSSSNTTTTTNQGTTQFDAQAQRNVHRSLLNPSYEDGDAAARKFKAGRVPSLSSQKDQASKNNNNNNLFERHQDFYTIDQSVNLMDAEAGKYESKQKGASSVQQMMHQSMVEIFLQDLSPSSTQDGKTKKSRSATGPWYHPHRQAQWDRMSTWEKVVDVAARLLIPLFLCAMVGLVVLVIVVVYYGSTTVPSSSNEVASASATSSSNPIDVVPTLPKEPIAVEEEPTDQVAAMTTLLSELSLVTPADLQDPKSAPSKALHWIAKDTIALAGLPVNGRRHLGAQQAAEEQLVQRFVLAVLYYEWMPKQVGGNVPVAAAAAARDSMSLEPGHAGPSGQASKTQGLWLSAQSECNWKGISCHNDVEDLRARATTTIDRSGPATTISASASSSSHVRKLNLTGHELTGTLPSILTALEQLHELDLRHNQIGGSLHQLDWTKWAHLEYLLLGDNRITGHLPWQFPALQKIVDVDLSNNQLTGKLPALSDGQDPLVELENLFLDGNALTGSIPDSFLRDMPHITYIGVSQNQLEGKLPFDALAELSELRFLHLSGNQLTGGLPPRMSKKLDTLSLGQNKLAGDVPDSLISDVKRLRHLELSQNEFQGPLPERLGELTHLKDLQLDRNQFSGDVPVWDALTHLETLKLHGNKLSGEVPDAVCAIDSSQSLQITADCDTGSIKCDCCDQCY
ncbi:Leucine rich repeat N-terminal domain [Seminavis robusta]|uniref:Leucine rich repeat N-terminal domain n=1 Tax=Seminavis robusta TaxID=568900 RepID=A0A9N8F2M0_9STRA|nr:Leucine rich repeat N-terminal domain [Seminavis robusta]|eukprot:Sro2450_g328060.1 Leucine rich repeat N-terminal domain (933) ;mRNA; f:5982-8919